MREPTDETALALSRMEARLDEIDAALGRLDEGSYTTCLSCGRVIADERLAAEPTTRWCGACEAAGELGERGPGGEHGTTAGPAEPAGEDRPLGRGEG